MRALSMVAHHSSPNRESLLRLRICGPALDESDRPKAALGVHRDLAARRSGKALNWFCTQPLSRTAKLKLFGCRTPSVEVPGVAAYGTSHRLVRSDAQLAGRAVALLSND
jgi:hypothetical protein